MLWINTMQLPFSWCGIFLWCCFGQLVNIQDWDTLKGPLEIIFYFSFFYDFLAYYNIHNTIAKVPQHQKSDSRNGRPNRGNTSNYETNRSNSCFDTTENKHTMCSFKYSLYESVKYPQTRQRVLCERINKKFHGWRFADKPKTVKYPKKGGRAYGEYI